MSLEFIRFGLGGAVLSGFAVAEVVLERSEMDRRGGYCDYDDLLWNTDRPNRERQSSKSRNKNKKKKRRKK